MADRPSQKDKTHGISVGLIFLFIRDKRVYNEVSDMTTLQVDLGRGAQRGSPYPDTQRLACGASL